MSALAALLLAASAATAQDAAAVTSKFEGFAQAAVACAEAVQSAEPALGQITSRGWSAYPQPDPAISAQVTTFARESDRILITVQKQPPQCTAQWLVSSPSGTDAVVATVGEDVPQALAQAFRGQFQPAPPLPGHEHDAGLYRFILGSAVVVLRMEAFSGTVLLSVHALNRAVVNQVLDQQSPPSAKTQKSH